VYGHGGATYGRRRHAAVWLLRAAVVAVPAFQAWTLSRARFSPFPLEGTWRVRSIQRTADVPATPSPLDAAETIYFERWSNEAVTAVLRRGDVFLRTNVSADPRRRLLAIDEMARNGMPLKPLFRGSYAERGDQLVLAGTAGGAPLRIELTRAPASPAR
jgi:hypothetical protein